MSCPPDDDRYACTTDAVETPYDCEFFGRLHLFDDSEVADDTRTAGKFVDKTILGSCHSTAYSISFSAGEVTGRIS